MSFPWIGSKVWLGPDPTITVLDFSILLVLDLDLSRVSDPAYNEMHAGSGSAWIDADPDPGGKKALKFFCVFKLNSVYLLGSGSVSIWTFLGFWIWIRMKTYLNQR